MSEKDRFRIGVLISGGGTNLQSIIDAAEAGSLPVSIAFVVSNKVDAGGLERAKRHGIPAHHISIRTHGSQRGVEEGIWSLIRDHDVDLLCLAGYLKRLSPWIIEKMPLKIINIHPGLLPFLGGQGMYGHHVHEAVIAMNMKITGVTIHFVDDKYDNGPIIAQECVPVLPDDDASTLAARVLKTEHSLYPRVIGWFARRSVRVEGRKVFIDDHTDQRS